MALGARLLVCISKMAATTELFDVCVVGAGVEGSSTARYLASRGKRTLLLEQFILPHTRGSSHGQTRIVRYGYQEDFLADLMPESFQMWDEIEGMSGGSLIAKVGVLQTDFPPSKEVASVLVNVRRLGQSCFSLSTKEAKEKFPGLAFSPNENISIEPHGGLIQADHALKALQEQFVMFGGTLRDGEKVVDIKPGSEVRIQTNKGTYKAKNVVLTPGSWINKLLSPLGVTLPTRIERINVTYWEAIKPELYTVDSGFPCFIFCKPLGYMKCHMYGFPIFEYPGLIKIVSHAGAEIKDPDNREDGRKDETFIQMTSDFVKATFPGVKPEPCIIESCLYTVTPDRNFVIDRHPQFNNIIIGAGFSGHGFKMAPVVGKILSQLALGEQTKYNIAPFRISRFKTPGLKASL